MPKGADKSNWVPDKQCDQCTHCQLHFTIRRRRHHCRKCGQVFCAACSKDKIAIPADHAVAAAEAGPKRVCRPCYFALSEHGSWADLRVSSSFQAQKKVRPSVSLAQSSWDDEDGDGLVPGAGGLVDGGTAVRRRYGGKSDSSGGGTQRRASAAGQSNPRRVSWHPDVVEDICVVERYNPHVPEQPPDPPPEPDLLVHLPPPPEPEPPPEPGPAPLLDSGSTTQPEPVLLAPPVPVGKYGALVVAHRDQLSGPKFTLLVRCVFTALDGIDDMNGKNRAAMEQVRQGRCACRR